MFGKYKRAYEAMKVQVDKLNAYVCHLQGEKRRLAMELEAEKEACLAEMKARREAEMEAEAWKQKAQKKPCTGCDYSMKYHSLCASCERNVHLKDKYIRTVVNNGGVQE